MKYISFIAVAFLFLSGCDETKTVDFYLKNQSERISMLDKCKSNPGELKKSPNCINAAEAANRLMFDSSNTGMPSIK